MRELLNTNLERILNHQQHLHFNVPYDDAEAERWGRYAVEKERDSLKEKYEDLQNKFKNFRIMSYFVLNLYAFVALPETTVFPLFITTGLIL